MPQLPPSSPTQQPYDGSPLVRWDVGGPEDTVDSFKDVLEEEPLVKKKKKKTDRLAKTQKEKEDARIERIKRASPIVSYLPALQHSDQAAQQRREQHAHYFHIGAQSSSSSFNRAVREYLHQLHSIFKNQTEPSATTRDIRDQLHPLTVPSKEIGNGGLEWQFQSHSYFTFTRDCLDSQVSSPRQLINSLLKNYSLGVDGLEEDDDALGVASDVSIPPFNPYLRGFRVRIILFSSSSLDLFLCTSGGKRERGSVYFLVEFVESSYTSSPKR